MLSPLVGFFARKSPRRKNFSEVSPLLPSKGQDVELAQWFYLEGTGTVAEVTEGEGEAKRTYSKVTFTAANVVNNKGTELRPAKTFTGEEYYEIELVRDDANAVVGAWIKNPAFGNEITETVTDEATGTSTTVVTGHTGFFTMKTDANGEFAFNDGNTAGLLPYVQFDEAGNPVAAGDEAATDGRRGAGTYAKVDAAMDLLASHGLPFGVSICYTHDNAHSVASDAYFDWLTDKGALFAWIFTYMPVGKGAPTELMPTPDDRLSLIHI